MRKYAKNTRKYMQYIRKYVKNTQKYAKYMQYMRKYMQICENTRNYAIHGPGPAGCVDSISGALGLAGSPHVGVTTVEAPYRYQ